MKLDDDDAYIVYVNSKIQDETALGRLMADFYEVNPDKMHHPTLADRTRYYKYEEGEIEVCRSIEALCEQAREEAHLEAELKKEVEHVCNLMQTLSCDEHTAMDMLEIPVERREAILQAIQKEK